jgi:hypothetical protein
MAALSITAANVVASTGAKYAQGTGGATIVQGKSVAFNGSKWVLAQCDGTALEYGSSGVGVALNACSDGQPIDVQTEGEITIGGTVTVGAIYCLGATAGDIVPFGDLVATNYVSILGVGISATKIKLLPIVSAVAVPA